MNKWLVIVMGCGIVTGLMLARTSQVTQAKNDYLLSIRCHVDGIDHGGDSGAERVSVIVRRQTVDDVVRVYPDRVA